MDPTSNNVIAVFVIKENASDMDFEMLKQENIHYFSLLPSPIQLYIFLRDEKKTDLYQIDNNTLEAKKVSTLTNSESLDSDIILKIVSYQGNKIVYYRGKKRKASKLFKFSIFLLILYTIWFIRISFADLSTYVEHIIWFYTFPLFILPFFIIMYILHLRK